jgi:NAD(P)-dependent dehydrogenase (short-subunit alcohol dehydrogenase family)
LKSAQHEEDEVMTDVVLSTKPILERFRLDGRAALVTGGGKGIGRAYAHALADAGAAVAIVDIDTESAEAVASELAAKGAESLALTVDVTRADQVQGMVDAVVKKWDRLTIAVNNAGIGDWTAAEDVTEENWDRINALNLKAVFLCAQAEGRVMLAAGYGKIINTASISGLIVNTPQKQMVYNTTKAGVIHLTRSLAAEWAGRGVRVNSISPGYTRTKLVDDLLATPEGGEVAPKWLELTPMRRMAEVTDLQGAVVYLAAEVSDYVTGHDMVIDGGYTCW